MKIEKRRWIGSAVGVLALTMASNAGAARLGPPSEYLVKAPHLVVIVEAREKLDDQRVVFERREVLLGEGIPEQMSVRVDEETFAVVTAGERYLLGYQILRQVARSRTLFEVDPEGPKAVQLPGMGDALLDDTPEMRRIILSAAAAEGAEEKATTRELLDLVLTQVVRPQAYSVRFVAAELLLRPELQEIVTAKDVEVLRQRLRTLAPDPFSRDLLLRAASTVAEREGSAWLAEECRHVLASYGTELDLGSPVPALLVTAAKALGKTGTAKDLKLLEKYFFSNNPGVAKASLKAMDALDSVATLKAVRKALEGDGLHTESRRALEVYVVRQGK